MNQTIYYWGIPDISVSFCEKKYIESFWIAEYNNTFSASAYIFLGFIFLFTKIQHVGYSMIILGISTAIMHATLRYYGQWMDECSMLIISYSALKLLKKNLSNTGYIFIIIYYFLIKDYFILFFLLFSSMQIYIVYLSYNKQLITTQKILILCYIISFSFGTICWFIDQLFCNYIYNIPFHALWHIFSALGMFYGFFSFVVL